MKKSLVVLAAVFAALSFAGCSKKEAKGTMTVAEGKYKVGVEIGYPPFEYYAEDGKTPSGFDIELGNEIASRLGLKAEFIDTAWDGIFAGLDTDRYDVVMSAATITPERLEHYLFSEPYIGNGQAIILTKNSPLLGKISSPSDLAGLKVGYQAETTSDFFMEKYAKANNIEFEPCEFDKVMNAYDDLKFGRCDAVVSDSLVAVSYLTKKDSPYVQVFCSIPDEYFGVCIKKGNTKLQEAVNKALEEMKADGTLKAIYEKVFGMDLSDSIKK